MVATRSLKLQAGMGSGGDTDEMKKDLEELKRELGDLKALKGEMTAMKGDISEIKKLLEIMAGKPPVEATSSGTGGNGDKAPATETTDVLIARMEKLAADQNEQVLDDNFCQKLAKEFNRSAGRAGSRTLQATQVQEWFLNKFPGSTTKPTRLPTASEEKALTSEVNVPISEKKAAALEEKLLALETSISNNEDELSPEFPIETTDNVPELEELEFEAKSAKDSAWYDIAIFLAHRRNKAGEVEVRVRYEGFGADEDEWVNVKKSVRQRSIPLEPSQCRNIREGDLVLCFREGNEEALHFDAHVLEIQRKQHDIRGCRCVFLVEYDHDQCQERVSLKRLSRRPKYL